MKIESMSAESAAILAALIAEDINEYIEAHRKEYEEFVRQEQARDNSV